MIEYVDPRAEPGVPVTEYRLRLAPSALTDNVRLAANAFPGSIDFMAELRATLGPLLPQARFTASDKGRPYLSSRLLAPSELEQIAGSSAAAVMGYGHCGSCTSAIVRDGAALARLGTPVVVLVTDKFVRTARFVARATGLPGLPLVFLPHPMSNADRQRRREVAERVAPEVLAALAPVAVGAAAGDL